MRSNDVQHINVKTLKERRDAQPDLCLIDVREQSEWDEQHIDGALHIPKGELASKIGDYVQDKDQPIYLHCRGGTRSLMAGQEIMALGYTNVYSIDGGITAWADSQYPIIR